MKISFTLLLLFISLQLFGQTEDSNKSDSLVAIAKEFAYSKRYEKSISILKTISTLDSKQLLARVYSWSGQYSKSLTVCNELISEFPEVVSNYQIAATTTLWGGKWSASYKFSQTGLDKNGNPLMFQTLQIKALNGAKKWREAELLTTSALNSYPSNEELTKLLQLIQQQLFQKEILINHNQDFFTLDSTYWKNTAFIIKNRTKYGPLIISANHSNRFSLKGLQGEFEFYPKLDSNYYAYIDLGFSQSELFPTFRNGVSVFRTFKKGYEFEIGYRNMVFNEAGSVWFFLGSATKYFGSNSFTYRYTSIHSPHGLSATHGLKFTHYFNDGRSTFSAEAGTGTNARDYQLYNTFKPFNTINSRRIQLDYRKFLNHRIAISMSTAFESALYRENKLGQRITFGIGLSSKF